VGTFDSPKTILITGASGAIGSALARIYAATDTILILTGRSSERLEPITGECREKGAQVISKAIDITDREALRRWLIEIDSSHPIDLVIANAGMTSNIGMDGKGESWEQIVELMETNTIGAMATVEPLIAPMQQRGKGQIAIMSSLAAYIGMPVTPAYCASKAAMKGYGEALRGWLAADGIGVSVIYPGFVVSAMSDRFPAPKPFMVTPEYAAIKIRRGLEKNRARISFPFPVNLGMRLLSCLPTGLSVRILCRLGYRPA
jgi:short-subunit dehydrogenase